MEYSPSLLRSFADHAIEFRKLEPWKTWYETQYFGVLNEATNEVDWVSIMGNSGEHRSIAIYLGSKGYQGFDRMLAAPSFFRTPAEDLNNVMDQSMLKVFYGNRNEIDQNDIEIFEKLNYRPKGRHQYFQAQSFQPFQFPQSASEAQLKYIVRVMKITMQVFRNHETHDLKLEEGNKRLIIRSLDERGGILDFYYDDPPEPQDEGTIPLLHPFLLNRIKQDVPRSEDFEHCFGVVVMPRPIQEENDPHPVFPSLVYSIMRGSGYVHKIEVVKDSGDVSVFQKFYLEELVALGKIPGTILVDSHKAAVVLQSVCNALDIKMLVVEDEEEFNDFIEGLINME